ncbi:Amino-acid carrier protein AlsT [Mycobacterium talmoniae]|uniref:Amino-acid carrier protein AlsT n=1 Tax=Mycobacterium talmoniae TaxID=1858794 RepID=A0A2S8BJ48_9MYCO|nr:Amino-acid carrier protein AlsT [Mycobacterium talmoniae]
MDVLQQQFLGPLGRFLYSYVLVVLLIGAGIYFTVRTRFVQVRYFRRMLHQLRRSGGADGEISSFQAFCVGLASRVGTGNIAGVAVALTLGGAGAVFWMWVTAALGMATALVEATLAQIFKVRAVDGGFRGGPAFYIRRGLGSRAGGVVLRCCWSSPPGSRSTWCRPTRSATCCSRRTRWGRAGRRWVWSC